MPETLTTQRWPHVPGCGPIAAQLIDKLSGGKPGDILTDEALQKHVGLDCSPDGKGYASLGTAIRACERKGVIWRRERSAACIRCLDAKDISSVATTYARSIRRTSHRAVRVGASADLTKLDASEQAAFGATLAQLGTIAMFADGKTHKRLAARHVEIAPEYETMMKLFEGANGNASK